MVRVLQLPRLLALSPLGPRLTHISFGTTYTHGFMSSATLPSMRSNMGSRFIRHAVSPRAALLCVSESCLPFQCVIPNWAHQGPQVSPRPTWQRWGYTWELNIYPQSVLALVAHCTCLGVGGGGFALVGGFMGTSTS